MLNEHKYLLNGCPDLVLQTQPVLIDQGWVLGIRLCRKTSPGGRTQYFGCLESGEDLVRSESSIPRVLFYLLWTLTRGKRVRKLRYTATVHGLRLWEVDVFLDRTLVLAEIEAPATDGEVALPAWLRTQVVREVTGDAAYADPCLAK